ncbi:5'-methylthioadenosine/S-adenosylhomocysteine nucleosidase family protein [Glycomyces arizonensis]|uniref:5'-methylthioadenosine/S-adenosylhomocysteine nucleosidase family protein n=1 Tax=Glycomyces arizonensis TaxID=256035 RepID=UPI0004101CAD|nr:5'-methylthioadenosine/S-adenosylhomocysteine nucleosidase [Glycomyces arizonensis]
MTGTVVVLTALDLEYKAVRAHLDDIETHRHEAGTRYESGTVRGTSCRITLGLTGVGNQSSAVIAERAIQEFAPLAVLFVGVAGSLWPKPGRGDVVVAERVYAYHGGTSEDDGLKARPRAWEAPHAVSQIAHHLERSGDWRDRLPAESGSPQVRFGAIAAGEVVQNSTISREAKWIRDHYNDAIAIEMEAAGVAHAGHLNSAAVGIVRGISDMADGTKNDDGDIEWQPRAAAGAAAFAVCLAEELINEREEIAMAANASESPAPAGNTVYNVASGSVGIQAANVSDATVWMGTAPTGERIDDLVAAVADLRARLDRDRANGEVDDDTYEAAQDELASAETALREPGRKNRKKAVLALKRLSGLAADTTSLGAKIALVIAAVGGLS